MANPRVELRRRSADAWVVWCVTGDCTYVDIRAVKTAAQQSQRSHARYHRMRQQERRALNQPEGS